MDLNGKCVLLGVSGGIAAYKMANVASALRKLGADVEVIMTRNATQFITPLTFETLTGHKCMVDTFDRDFKFEVTHISLAKLESRAVRGESSPMACPSPQSVYSLSSCILPHFAPSYKPVQRFCCAGGTFALY